MHFDSIPVKRWRVLVAEPDASDSAAIVSVLGREFPDVDIIAAHTLVEFGRALEGGTFDILILSYELGLSETPILLARVKTSDFEAGLIILADHLEPVSVAALYNSGVHRFLSKRGDWLRFLPQVFRETVNLRKNEETIRHRNAQLTETNQLLEEKNQRLVEFAATLAHDIRGPLGTICMKLDYILEFMGEKVDSRVQTLISGALESTQRLTDVVQAMYEYARLGAKAARMADIDLKALVQQVVSDMPVPEDREVQVGIGELPHVWGNADLLRRVFINLFSNSVRYADKPELIINIGCNGFVDRSIARFAEIFFEDNGPGISEQDRAQIFRIFSRGVNERKGDGLGVGLSVVQHIVELHYGKVVCESELGQGARFVFLLPLEAVVLGVSP